MQSKDSGMTKVLFDTQDNNNNNRELNGKCNGRECDKESFH